MNIQEQVIFPHRPAADKVERYKWKVKDLPGETKRISKDVLRVNAEYQRSSVGKSKVLKIASNWSWVACGVLIVAERNGEYWVVDGQHRLMAAKKRSDIDLIPCIVFDTEEIAQEAQGFVNVNTGRKPLTSVDIFRANLVARDPLSLYVNSVFDRLGIIPTTSARSGLHFKCINWAMRKAQEDKATFEEVLELTAALCQECFIQEILVDGLWYLKKRVTQADHKFNERVKKVGVEKLTIGARRTASAFARGGAKVWAEGMLMEINRGLQKKFTLRDEKS